MAVIKWDGVTDADLILKALLFFIDEEDEEKALKTSYGDFGKYLQKMYRGSGAGNGDINYQSSFRILSISESARIQKTLRSIRRIFTFHEELRYQGLYRATNSSRQRLFSFIYFAASMPT